MTTVSLSWKLRAQKAEAEFRGAYKAGIDAAIHEVATGRTINNFGHVSEVRRALEWVMMDLEGLKEGKQ